MDLESERIGAVLEMQLEFASMLRVRDFRVGSNRRRRQMSEGGQIRIEFRRSVRVIGSGPVESGEGVRNPVEVVADNVTGGIGEREVDEEDSF